MIVRITTRLTVAAVGISTFLGLMIAVGLAQVLPPLSEVKATVFDETGAVIPGCEIVFRSDSETIVSHTGTDGSVTFPQATQGTAGKCLSRTQRCRALQAGKGRYGSGTSCGVEANPVGRKAIWSGTSRVRLARTRHVACMPWHLERDCSTMRCSTAKSKVARACKRAEVPFFGMKF